LPTGLKAAVEEFEERHIAWVLRAANGNREHAAKMLEIDTRQRFTGASPSTAARGSRSVTPE